MDRTFIEQLIEKHEGRRAAVYTDPRGNLTIGVGLNLEGAEAPEMCASCGLDYWALRAGRVTLTDAEIDELFATALNGAIYGARCQVPSFNTLPDKAQAVVVDMVFNMGAPRFSEFVQFKAALAASNWEKAAAEIRDSLWCGQVKTRCEDNQALLQQCGVAPETEPTA